MHAFMQRQQITNAEHSGRHNGIQQMKRCYLQYRLKMCYKKIYP